MPHGLSRVMEVARPVRGRLPWGRMARAALGVGVPLSAGLVTGGTIPGVLVALGGLVGALADRPGSYPLRVRGIALAGGGGAIGVFLGSAVYGRGWPAVAVLVLVAGVSALVSTVGTTWSVAALCLLVYAVLGSGPLGSLQPWWMSTPLVAAGICWALLLVVPEWALQRRGTMGRARSPAPRRTGAAPPTPGRGTLPRRLAVQVREARLAFTAVSGLRLMVCIAVAGVVSDVLPLDRSYWVVLAAAVVVRPAFGSSFTRAAEYAACTVLGAVIGELIVAAGPPEAVRLVLVVALTVLLPLGASRSHGRLALVLTPLVILLVAALVPTSLAPAEGRLLDIALGCAIALGIGYAPWRWTWRANLPRAFARAVDRAADYLDSTLPTCTAASAATAQGRAHRELVALRMELRRAVAEPEPARHQVAAWSSAADAVEGLLDAVTAVRTGGGRLPSPTEVAQVNETLREVAAAARSGALTPGERSLSTAESLEHVTEAVRRLLVALQRVAPAGKGASVRGPTRLPGRGE